MKKSILLRTLLIGFGASLLAGCVRREVVYAPAPPPPATAEVAPQQPAATPPPQVEVVPPQPNITFVWVPGAWEWRGRWVWIAGRWAPPPHPGAIWVRGVWVRHGHRYVWARGHWR